MTTDMFKFINPNMFNIYILVMRSLRSWRSLISWRSGTCLMFSIIKETLHLDNHNGNNHNDNINEHIYESQYIQYVDINNTLDYPGDQVLV